MASCILGEIDEAGVLLHLSRSSWSGTERWTARDSNGGCGCLDPVVGGQVLNVSN